MPNLTIDELKSALAGTAAGFRSITRLQPLEGPGGKIFPATYSGGAYAKEKRRIQNGAGPEIVDCVIIDSVQSQSNRAEQALKHAVESGRIVLPLIEVDFTTVNEGFTTQLENVTSLDVPHRLADAILRDSELADGTRFSKSDYAKRWSRSNLWDATAIYELCPTALLFGMWGSPEKPGGLGAKFERAYVSEMIAIDVLAVEKRQGYRIDPIQSSKNVLLKAKGDGSYQVVNTGGVKPSELNHGNIPFDSNNGGITCRYIEQSTVVSLGALRKLRFPVNGKEDAIANDAGRTVLAALGLCAGVLVSEMGTSLRSRCHLVPEAPREWELIDKPGQTPRSFSLDGSSAIALLESAVEAAHKTGLAWRTEKILLRPTKGLTDLIAKSQEFMAKEKGEGRVE